MPAPGLALITSGLDWEGCSEETRLYPSVRGEDVPFAQNFLGDQFLLRDKSVLRLFGETGEIEDLGVGWSEFLELAAVHPDKYLSLNLLSKYRGDGETLDPGELLNVYPPLCTKEAADGVSLKAISALERLRFLADFAKQIANISEGTQARITIK